MSRSFFFCHVERKLVVSEVESIETSLDISDRTSLFHDRNSQRFLHCGRNDRNCAAGHAPLQFPQTWHNLLPISSLPAAPVLSALISRSHCSRNFPRRA